VEGILTVFGGKDTLQRDFFGLFKRNEQTFRTILYKVLDYYDILEIIFIFALLLMN